MIRRYISSLTGAVTPPADPVLRLSVVVAGSFITFQARLTRPLDANLTINRVFADNFLNCGFAAQGALQQNVAQVITAGSLGITFGYQILSGTVNTSNNRLYNVIINSAPVNNGDTITVGSFSVDVSIQQCGEAP